MDEIVKDFLIESNENLDRLDQELVKLESDPSSAELLASVFRTIHTIKGSCGFLGFGRLEKLTHAGESLLARLRDGEIRLNADVASGLLAMVDSVRRMLGSIQVSGLDGEENYDSLIELLSQLSRPGHEKAEAVAPPSEPQLAGPPSQAAPALALTETGVSEESRAATPSHESHAIDAPETVRVGVTLLDRLMILVGELALARNQLLQFSNRTQDAGLQAVSQRVNLIASELQEEVMKTRMQPIANLWNKFPRTVRDLALNCGKDVRLEMEGQDTELDRTIIEAIKDPLTHLVRNAMDHGIEDAETRQRADKNATGVLRLRAFHEGGQVNIEISDDGAGLNSERIRQRAVARGLLPAQAPVISERDIFNLIFLPGFSTAEKVTKVSGRGVGMDVVKTNVEKIGGTVDIQSTPGRGTTVRVKIPLTLAIIPALIVTCGGERFAIPQVSLLELVRLDDAENRTESRRKGIELVHGAPVYRLRGRLLPLMYLDRELGIRSAADRESNAPATINIVVLQAENHQFGLIVDEITDTEEIVVKPLGKQLQAIGAYSGATIMGDGRVALILDVSGLAQKAKLIWKAHEPAHHDAQIKTQAGSLQQEHGMLLVENGLEGRLAIPLSMVARLEEFPKTVIERTGNLEVMQYRGQIIPLVRLSGIIPCSSDAEALAHTQSIQVVIYAEGKRSVGLIVDRIVDIVEERAPIEPLISGAGIAGSFVIQHQVTELLDIPTIMRAAVPGLMNVVELEATGG
ncbi:MAG: histidine kinase [Acidobacteria bacterium]|nr:MAG: histidine kinase [Acidobacteriota bacterium]